MEDLYDPSLTHLEASNAGIADLSGLEHAVHLESLNLPGNAIADLSPLVDLRNLRSLRLNGNSIDDIGPLASLHKLTVAVHEIDSS